MSGPYAEEVQSEGLGDCTERARKRAKSGNFPEMDVSTLVASMLGAM